MENEAAGKAPVRSTAAMAEDENFMVNVLTT
jgi:hypothetical protein